MCANINVKVIHIAYIWNIFGIVRKFSKKSLIYGKIGKIYIQDYMESIFN